MTADARDRSAARIRQTAAHGGAAEQAGRVLGLLALYRETGQREFDRDEIRFLAAVAGPLAEGARRGLLPGEATHPDGPHGGPAVPASADRPASRQARHGQHRDATGPS